MAVLYRHIRLDTNTPFYVGIGQDEKRAYSRQRSNHWKRIVQKHGYKVHIMLDDLTWEQAQEKEREFIKLYGRKDLGLGILINKTDGGEGSLGAIRSVETRAKVSISKTGKLKTEEHRKKIKASSKNTPILQYDLNGNFINEWYSLRDAGKALNINVTNIANVAKNKTKSAGNFIWKYKTN